MKNKLLTTTAISAAMLMGVSVANAQTTVKGQEKPLIKGGEYLELLAKILKKKDKEMLVLEHPMFYGEQL